MSAVYSPSDVDTAKGNNTHCLIYSIKCEIHDRKKRTQIDTNNHESK